MNTVTRTSSRSSFRNQRPSFKPRSTLDGCTPTSLDECILTSSSTVHRTVHNSYTDPWSQRSDKGRGKLKYVLPNEEMHRVCNEMLTRSHSHHKYDEIAFAVETSTLKQTRYINAGKDEIYYKYSEHPTIVGLHCNTIQCKKFDQLGIGSIENLFDEILTWIERTNRWCGPGVSIYKTDWTAWLKKHAPGSYMNWAHLVEFEWLDEGECRKTGGWWFRLKM